MEIVSTTINPADPLTRFLYGLPPASAKRHQGRLKSFLAEIGVGAGTELSSAAIEFVKKAHENPEWTEHVLLGFIISQTKRVDDGSIRPGTLETHYKVIKRFCKKNRIVLDWEMIRGGVPHGVSAADDRAPTPDEIQHLVKDKDPRVRPIAYLMTACGMRLEAWDFLRWKHIEPKTDPENGALIAASVIVYAGQNRGKKKQYRSFITPQAYSSLKSWMDYRTLHNETISGDSWVMRDLWRTSNIRRGGAHGLAGFPHQLKHKGVKTLMGRALWRQGIRTAPTKRHPFKGLHGFRKFFMTHVEQAGMKSINVKVLMGHSIGVENSYYRPSEWDILQDYLKAVPYLTIGSSSNQEVLQAEKDKQSTSQENEIQSLKGQMEILVKQVSHLSDTVQNYKDDYNWVRGGKSEPILINKESRINRLGIDALLEQDGKTDEDKKMSEEHRKELERMRKFPSSE